jgi:hypothetical protein
VVSEPPLPRRGGADHDGREDDVDVHPSRGASDERRHGPTVLPRLSPLSRRIFLAGAIAVGAQATVSSAGGPAPLQAATDDAAAGNGASDVCVQEVCVADVDAPSGGDDAPLLQAAMDRLGAAGGLLSMQYGTYVLGSPITVPNKVVLRGAGRDATLLRADPRSFPEGEAVIALGRVDELAFSSRVENCTVDAAGVADTTCVNSEQAQESSGLAAVVLTNFTRYGVRLGGVSANIGVDRVEAYPHPSGGTYGVYVDGAPGTVWVRDTTIGVSGELVAGIYLKNCTALVESAHVEKCRDGVVWDGSSGSLVVATGRSVADGTAVNLVRMTPNSAYVSAFGLSPNNYPTTVRDEFFDLTATGFVPSWVGGHQYVGRLHHYGDLAGFFGAIPVGKPSVTGSRGDGTALASLVAGLVQLGLVADESTP